MDIQRIRDRIAEGIDPWKTLDELVDDAEVRTWLADEFPNRTSLPTTSRRDLLRLMGAALAMAGLTGCRGAFMPRTQLVPYVDGPAEETYGQPVRYRSSLVRHGYGFGIEVVTRDGRPVKVEGSPDHPASLGSTDAIAQASLLQFYDPDRSRAPIYEGQESTWEAFLTMVQDSLGSGVRVLTETVTSPTLTRQLKALQHRIPGLRVHAYEPINRDAAYAASQLAFGRRLAPVYSLKESERFLGVGFDLDRAELGGLVQMRELVGRAGRIYSVSSTPTLLNPVADHNRVLAPYQIGVFMRELASAVTAGAGSATDSWTKAVAQDLLLHPGKSCVAVAENQSPEIQALGYAVNAALGNLGRTISFVDSPESSPASQADSIKELVQDMAAGKVGLLLILGANPVYHVPAELGFTEAMSSVALRVHHGLYRDETGLQCQWHLPAPHEFEAWTDVLAFDGTPSIVQPILEPIYSSRSAHQLIASLTDLKLTDREIVRETWSSLSDETWREFLRLGTRGKAKLVAVPDLKQIPQNRPPNEGVAVIFRRDPSVDDGRHANNGWLQEVPNPHTGLVWDNALLVSPTTAERLELSNGDHLEIFTGARSLVGPIWITPGQADDCVTVHLGGGRSCAGVVGNGVGYDSSAICSTDFPDLASATIRKVHGRTELVSTQSHHRMEGQDLVKTVALGTGLPQETANYGFDGLTAQWDKTPGVPQWGMSIDLDRCTGCNACVVACQAENNISTVGKEEVRRGREMQWIRIDRYYAGKDLDNPEVLLQPVTCMHCETAPCEPVCPVAATVHTHEGLNQMIYNRCVGTRYCSNNCPYKVRRFNYLNYQLLQPNYSEEGGLQLLRLLNNPDVTVRSRGVMEKCSYCIQRISAAKVVADQDGRPIRDGEVVPACGQACPAQAIAFGDLTDAKSTIHRLRNDPRQYPLLPQLLTVPRTTYLARVHNANPEIANA